VLLEAFVEYKALYTDQGLAATTPASEEVLARLQEGPVWAAVSEGEIVGTASAVLKSESLHIRGMAVLPVARAEESANYYWSRSTFTLLNTTAGVCF